MYVKLFGSILDSSIWTTDLATRVVWITMLAMADEHGVVMASRNGLARRAAVSPTQCRHALKTLSSPDDDDRSGVEGGVRIRELQGGWELVNYQHYRELRSRKQIADAARQARYRKAANVTERDAAVTDVTRHDVTVEAEAEADKNRLRAASKDFNGAARRDFSDLKSHVPEAYHDAIKACLRSAQNPTAVLAIIRGAGPGGIHEVASWEIVGRAILELQSTGGAFSPLRLNAFCKRLVAGDPTTDTNDAFRAGLQEIARNGK